MSSKYNCSERRQRVAQLLCCYLCMVPAYSSTSFTTCAFLTCCSDSAPQRTSRPSSALLAVPKQDDNKRPRDRRFTQSVHQQSNNNNSQKKFNADRKGRTTKSIDELENRLASRWGTDLNKWTAQDADDDDEEEEEKRFKDNSATKVGGDTSVLQFRARPVNDPWADKEKSSTSQSRRSSFLSSRDDGDDGDTNTRLARRAQRNQERLAERKNVQVQRRVHDNGGSAHDEYKTRSRDQNKTTKSDKLRVRDLISPKPVGGQGTFRTSDDRSTPQQPFFFLPRVAKEGEGDDSEQEQPRSDRERSPAIPIMDRDGNPLLLTLEQAESDFKDSLGTDNDSGEDETSNDSGVHGRNGSDKVKDWKDLGIASSFLLENLESVGFAQPLSVQQKTCPPILSGLDLLVGTYTGSGKTLAFLVPLIQRLTSEERDKNGDLKVLIVAPGRELASQIVSVARELLQGTGLSVMMAIGGTTFARNLEQIRKRKPDILVGTPGRIAELVVGRPGERGGRLKIGRIQSLVLDEFDALLEYKPHRDPTNAIFQCLKQRHGDCLQSILCSATASDMIGSPKLDDYLRKGYSFAMADKDDVLVTSTNGGSDEDAKVPRVSRTVVHGVIHVAHRRLALETLRRILHTDPIPQQILIFVESSRKVNIVVEKLDRMGVIAAPLHGGRGSEKQDRAEVSKALREGFVGIVVATELAARGLDAPLLTHVINLDLPTDCSHYAHRAGRCGRGGRPGVVINMTTSPMERNVPRKFADQLGVNLYTVEPRNGKLNIVVPGSVNLDL